MNKNNGHGETYEELMFLYKVVAASSFSLGVLAGLAGGVLGVMVLVFALEGVDRSADLTECRLRCELAHPVEAP